MDIINTRSGKVLESHSVDEVSQVQIVGSDRTGDRITVDLSAAAVAPVPGGIVVNGGTDAGNTVDLIGADGANSVVVDGNQLSVNGTTIEYSNIDSIRWHGNGDDDDLTTIEAGKAQFVVVDNAIPDEMNGRPGNEQDPKVAVDQIPGPTTTPGAPARPQSRPGQNGSGRRTGPSQLPAGISETLSRTDAVDAALADLGNLAPTRPVNLEFVARRDQERRRG